MEEDTGKLARREVALSPFEPASFADAIEMAERLAKSGLLPAALRGKPTDVLVVLMKGRDLGLSPMQALSGIHVIEGRAACSADLLAALCLRHPDVCEAFFPEVYSATKCVYLAKRRGQTPARFEFTIEDANRAGLTGRDNWKRYPADMLAARASARAARRTFPELVLGMLVDDEADDLRAPPIPVAPFVAPPAPAPAAPAPRRTRKPEPEDAELVPEAPPPEPEPEEPRPEPEPRAVLTDEDKIKGWRTAFANASTLEALGEVGRALAESEPKDSAIRRALSPDYAKRQAEIRRHP